MLNAATVADQQVPTPSVTGGFQRANVTRLSELDIAALVGVLDLQEQLPPVRRLRDWTLRRLAPAAGELCLDIGCGTGTEARQMAALVRPGGRVIGLDANARLLDVARSRTSIACPVDWIEGVAEDLPLGDASVDVVRCERVLQHLPDPGAAVAEFARVLRPGGRIALVDSDWGTAIASFGDPPLIRRVQEAWWARTPNPFAGRHLHRHLKDAGLLVDPDVGSGALVFPPRAMVGGGIFGLQVGNAVADGALSREESDRLLAALAHALERDEAFLSVTIFAVVATKPAARRTEPS